ncbi:MAG: hypothetical protein HY719_00530 [Planctomycetes bacterium]|nr:hypothetical protein [Planctomycetota bacterium]
MSHDPFADEVLSGVPPGGGRFPFVYYDADGDCVEFIATNESFYAERIDSLVTVFYGRESGEIVGSLIKGVRRTIREICERAPGFRIEIQDGRIRLSHLFLARLWTSPGDGSQVVVYQKLRQVASHADATVTIDQLALS